MKKIQRISIAIFIISSISSFAILDTPKNDCAILHEGIFKYGNTNDEIKVVIKGKNHTEYHDGGKYIIKSKLEWVSDCEYNMTMTKITISNFPYAKGDVMNVKINQVTGDEIFYTSTVKGQSWNGKLIKIN